MNLAAVAPPVLLFLASAVGVASMQPGLARTVHEVKAVDVYVLPPPAELHAATLGWDAAAVDQLWAKLLVEYGTHWSEKHEFLDVPHYTDAILELEPDYAPIYQYVDTLLAYRPLQGTEDDVRMARAYLERGTRERPDDPRVWREYGQFIAFIGPSFLHKQADVDKWRHDGAIALAHAAELGDIDSALSAGSMLKREGSIQQAIEFFEKFYALTEHPSMAAVHEQIGLHLKALHAKAAGQEADATEKTIEERWQREMPFVGIDRYKVLGPVVDAARCAGIAASDDPACAHDWRVSESPGSSAGSP